MARVQLLLDNLTGCPALVFGCRMDVLAWNDLGGALYELPGPVRAMVVVAGVSSRPVRNHAGSRLGGHEVADAS